MSSLDTAPAACYKKPMPIASLAFPPTSPLGGFLLEVDGHPVATLRADYLEREGALVFVDVHADAPAWLTAAEALRLGDALLGADIPADAPGPSMPCGPAPRRRARSAPSPREAALAVPSVYPSIYRATLRTRRGKRRVDVLRLATRRAITRDTDGDLMPVARYRREVRKGILVDSDGYCSAIRPGYLTEDARYAFKPSAAPEPRAAAYVVWVNR